jgi:ribonucleotide monophosphatase NagD (HAD superfamily)
VAKLTAKQGLIGQAYENMGGKVFAIGKPFLQIYRNALQKLEKARGLTPEEIHQMRIAMVGDTLETDILGAQNASENIGCKIDGILVMSGIFAGEMSKNGVATFTAAAMDRFFCEKKIRPMHALSALSMGADVYF